MRNCFVAFLLPSLAAASIGATPFFKSGNLAVLRVGDGTQKLDKSGNTVLIDQFNTNGVLLGSTNLPASGVSALILSGVAGSEGGLTRSSDRTALALAGYNVALGTVSGSLSSTASTTVLRAVATVDAFGAFDLQEATASFFSQQNPRYATTDGSNNFWAVGGTDGVVYMSPPGSAASLNDSSKNNRAIKIYNGNIYFTSQKASPVGLYTLVPPGLPRTISVGTNLVIDTGSSSSPEGLALSPSGTLAYIADSGGGGAHTQGGGVQKWAFNGTSWTWAYTFPVASAPQPPGAFGLTVDFSGSSPIIYATTVETNAGSGGNVAGNHLVRIIDTNATAVVTALAQASDKEVFRGVDFAPDLLPEIVVQPQSQTVTNGASNVSLAVSALSAFALSYEWRNNGAKVTNSANVTGATTAALTFSSAANGDQGSYSVVISNQYGAVTSMIATLTVGAGATAPVIVSQPLSQTNFAGGAVSFTVVASGTPTPAYQWAQVIGGVTNILVNGTGASGETFSGATNAMLTIQNVQPNDAGAYFVIASNLAGATNSRNAFLDVLSIPPGIISEPKPQAILTGQTADFTVSASGTAPSYQWTFKGAPLSSGTGPDGEVISGATSSHLEIQNAQTNDTGPYAVIVSNTAGATNSVVIGLDVVTLPPPSFISYSAVGAVYSQNFNSLPAPASTTVKADNPVTIGAVTYSFGNADPIDFAAPVLPTKLPGGLGLSSTMAGWYGWVDNAGNNRFGANNGDQTSGGFQSFGLTNSFAASTNRALGLLTTGTNGGSGTGSAAMAARFVNKTPATLNRINLQFTGELWRQFDIAKALTFYYVVDLTGTNGFDTNAADFTYVPSLTVAFLTNGADVGGTNVNGTLPANQVTNAVSDQAIANWPPGAALWLVWAMTNTIGQAQGIGIDNLTFSAFSTVSGPELGALTFTAAGAGAGFGFSFIGASSNASDFTIWSSTNLGLPFSQWSNLGHPAETSPGVYQFTDGRATNFPAGYYEVTSP